MSLTLESDWQPIFLTLLQENSAGDAAHDLQHIQRVVTNARRLSQAEGAEWSVVMPAAWLHDCVAVPKSSPLRTQASRLSAQQAVRWLEDHGWRHGNLEEIAHAIEAHSFSAKIPPLTLEAKVLQDADRLDALGAVGLARTLMLGAEMQRAFYDPADPFCDRREADDSIFTLDHFYCKLLKLEDTMQTASGRDEARQRTAFLRDFLLQMQAELHGESGR
jgi:uncharacterized protein